MTAFSIGWGHALAVLSNGQVWAWGSDHGGELGDGPTVPTADCNPNPAVTSLCRPAPIRVSAISGAVDVEASRGAFTSFAILRNRKVMAWGRDGSGQLGNGLPLADKNAPVPVPALSNVLQISGGGDDGERAFALLGPLITCNGNDATIFYAPFTGTNGNDVIVGTSAANVINGNAGNDLICAGGGNDTVNGGSGNDSIFGQTDDDKMDGGPGLDTVDGGPDTDTITFPGALGRTVDLGAGTASGEGPGVRIRNVENVQGSNARDILIGSSLANRLEGLGGNDTLRGALGTDVLLGGLGSDSLGGQGGVADRCDGGASTDSYFGGTKAASGCEISVAIP